MFFQTNSYRLVLSQMALRRPLGVSAAVSREIWSPKLVCSSSKLHKFVRRSHVCQSISLSEETALGHDRAPPPAHPSAYLSWMRIQVRVLQRRSYICRCEISNNVPFPGKRFRFSVFLHTSREYCMRRNLCYLSTIYLKLIVPFSCIQLYRTCHVCVVH